MLCRHGIDRALAFPIIGLDQQIAGQRNETSQNSASLQAKGEAEAGRAPGKTLTVTWYCGAASVSIQGWTGGQVQDV